MSGHQTIEERFWAKVDRSGDCWEWTASIDEFGYGYFRVGDNMSRAHRVSADIAGMEIPAGMCVLHTCDKPPCVRPDHLFVGSRDDNAKDRNKKKRQSSGLSHSAACRGSSRSVLSDSDILEIRGLCGKGAMQKDIASEYGVSSSLVSLINVGHNRTYVE